MNLKMKRYLMMGLTAVNMREASLRHEQKLNSEVVLKYNSRLMKEDNFGFGWKSQPDVSLLTKNGYQLQWSHTPRPQVLSISSQGKILAKFKYSQNHLVQLQIFHKNKEEHFTYEYNEFSNLIEIRKNQQWQQKIGYDNFHDWVIQVQDSHGCRHHYSYESSIETHRHSNSQVSKTCPGKKIETRIFSFQGAWKKTGRKATAENP